MEERLEPLLVERAPWLFEPGIRSAICKPILDKMLNYQYTLELGRQMDPLSAEDMMTEVQKMLAKHLTVKSLSNLPASGPAMIVANHPTGIADGLMLNEAMSSIRNDAFFYANSDIIRVFPQYATVIAPVEWRLEKRSHAKMKETIGFTRKAVDQGRIGVIFPSGRLAKRRGLRLYERPWMASAATIARKFDLPIIPVNIRARNSALFYFFDLIHPTLRDITLFYEMLNKDRQPFHIAFGEPISPSSLPKDAEEAIELLRRETLRLGEPSLTLVSREMRPASALF